MAVDAGAADEFIPDRDPPLLPSGVTVKVTGPRKGRRRVGREFGREPVVIPIEDLSEAELTALLEDSALTVELV